MKQVQIKVSAFVQTLDYVGETFGQAAAAGVLATLPEDLQQQIGVGLSDRWVTFGLFTDMLDELIERFGAEAEEVVRDSGYFTAKREFPRRFGALKLPAGAPIAEALNRFTPFWRLMVSQGFIEAKDGGEHVELHICELSDASEAYGLRLCGWLEGYLECLTDTPWRVELVLVDPAARTSLLLHLHQQPAEASKD